MIWEALSGKTLVRDKRSKTGQIEKINHKEASVKTRGRSAWLLGVNLCLNPRSTSH